MLVWFLSVDFSHICWYILHSAKIIPLSLKNIIANNGQLLFQLVVLFLCTQLTHCGYKLADTVCRGNLVPGYLLARRKMKTEGESLVSIHM